MPSFASVVLVDPRGWLLLQERDEHPRIDPDRWGLCGGHLEPGEQPEAGAYRELAEESGLQPAPGTLHHWRSVEVFHEANGSHDPVHLFVAGLDLRDADVVCHEGRQIRFVDPAEVGSLPLTALAAQVLPELIDSDEHHELRHAAAGRVPVVLVLLVDDEGRVLLQERDAGAPTAPETWSLPGGRIEPGEQPEAAARRELAEETGLALPAGSLHRIGAFTQPLGPLGPAADVELWGGATCAREDEVECHEGRQMCFRHLADPEVAPWSPATALALALLRATASSPGLPAGVPRPAGLDRVEPMMSR